MGHRFLPRCPTTTLLPELELLLLFPAPLWLRAELLLLPVLFADARFIPVASPVWVLPPFVVTCTEPLLHFIPLQFAAAKFVFDWTLAFRPELLPEMETMTTFSTAACFAGAETLVLEACFTAVFCLVLLP